MIRYKSESKQTLTVSRRPRSEGPAGRSVTFWDVHTCFWNVIGKVISRVMLRPTDDLRITQVRPLVPPAILLEEIPISEAASNVVSNTRLAVTDVLAGRDPRLVVVAGPCSIHDPAAALEYAQRLRPLAERYRGSPDRRPPQLLREAADLRRLERAHQRSRSRRQLPHQQGAAAGPQVPARRQRSRAADGVGIPRHADSAAHRRPDGLGGDRRADDGEPGAPRARVGAVDAGRIQEQHGREHADGGRRRPVGAFAALVSVGDEAGRVGDLRDDGERRPAM